ncbi:MAG: hypothetical protein ABNH03_03280 [Alteromonas sp.]|jgi:hypothetical protein|uniref:hypothetical protein n=1 Tax=Alteromonas sp. TaxID=232 RepID=UPI0032D93EC2
MLKYVLVFLSLNALHANAELITHNGHTLDTQTNIISTGQMQWLQWDVTLGKNVNWFLGGGLDQSLFGSGWRLANNTEVAALLNTFFPENSWDSDPSTTQYFSSPNDGLGYLNETNSESQFVDLFSNTSEAAFGEYIAFGEKSEVSGAIFGDDITAQKFNFVEVIGDRFDSFGNSRDSNVILRDTWLSAGSISPLWGLALVRDVPEPSFIHLFLIFTFLLFVRKAKIHST